MCLIYYYSESLYKKHIIVLNSYLFLLVFRYCLFRKSAFTSITGLNYSGLSCSMSHVLSISANWILNVTPVRWRSHWDGKGAEYHPWQRKICQKSGKRGKNSEKRREKSGRKGKNREGSFTLLLLTDRAGFRYCRSRIVSYIPIRIMQVNC